MLISRVILAIALLSGCATVSSREARQRTLSKLTGLRESLRDLDTSVQSKFRDSMAEAEKNCAGVSPDESSYTACFDRWSAPFLAANQALAAGYDAVVFLEQYTGYAKAADNAIGCIADKVAGVVARVRALGIDTGEAESLFLTLAANAEGCNL